MAESANTAASHGTSCEAVLRQYRLWEGWGQFYDTIPLGPKQELQLPPREEDAFEVLGFAVPLPPVEYAKKNERRYPPPTDEEMYREMFKLLQGLVLERFKRSYVLAIIFGHINRNKRDSPGWQKAFIKVGGVSKLFEIWRNPKEERDEDDLPDKYWAMAIIGRMLGTCTESRELLIAKNAVQLVLEGMCDPDSMVRECSQGALKGLITHPEGRRVVTYSMLAEFLSGSSEGRFASQE